MNRTTSRVDPAGPQAQPARTGTGSPPGSTGGDREEREGVQTFASTIFPLESTVQFKVASRTSKTPFRSP